MKQILIHLACLPVSGALVLLYINTLLSAGRGPLARSGDMEQQPSPQTAVAEIDCDAIMLAASQAAETTAADTEADRTEDSSPSNGDRVPEEGADASAKVPAEAAETVSSQAAASPEIEATRKQPPESTQAPDRTGRPALRGEDWGGTGRLIGGLMALLSDVADSDTAPTTAGDGSLPDWIIEVTVDSRTLCRADGLCPVFLRARPPKPLILIPLAEDGHSLGKAVSWDEFLRVRPGYATGQHLRLPQARAATYVTKLLQHEGQWTMILLIEDALYGQWRGQLDRALEQRNLPLEAVASIYSRLTMARTTLRHTITELRLRRAGTSPRLAPSRGKGQGVENPAVTARPLPHLMGNVTQGGVIR